MSVKVEVHKLAAHLPGRPLAYLLTVTDDQHPHAVAVSPEVRGSALRFTDGLGRRTRANLAARPDVTLLWPPGEVGGYTLIADGRVSVEGDVATFVPAQAVLHRSAEHAAGPSAGGSTGCGNDCVPLGEA
jgi:hypothetical protein